MWAVVVTCELVDDKDMIYCSRGISVKHTIKYSSISQLKILPNFK